MLQPVPQLMEKLADSPGSTQAELQTTSSTNSKSTSCTRFTVMVGCEQPGAFVTSWKLCVAVFWSTMMCRSLAACGVVFVKVIAVGVVTAVGVAVSVAVAVGVGVTTWPSARSGPFAVSTRITRVATTASAAVAENNVRAFIAHPPFGFPRGDARHQYNAGGQAVKWRSPTARRRGGRCG